MSRAQIVAEARSWLGTPYHHQAANKGHGCDCLGLLRGVYRNVLGYEPEAPPPYSPTWGERRDRGELMLAAATRHLEPVEAPCEGAAVFFRVAEYLAVKHCGILTGDGTFVHAYQRYGVVEQRFAGVWAARAVAFFNFPEA